MTVKQVITYKVCQKIECSCCNTAFPLTLLFTIAFIWQGRYDDAIEESNKGNLYNTVCILWFCKTQCNIAWKFFFWLGCKMQQYAWQLFVNLEIDHFLLTHISSWRCIWHVTTFNIDCEHLLKLLLRVMLEVAKLRFYCSCQSIIGPLLNIFLLYELTYIAWRFTLSELVACSEHWAKSLDKRNPSQPSP